MKGKVGCLLLFSGYLMLMSFSFPALENMHDRRNMYRLEEKKINAVLYVEGEYVTDENVTIHKVLNHLNSDFASIPFLGTLKALGYDVRWQGKERLYLDHKDNSYVIDLEKEKLIQTKPSCSEEWFVPLCGGFGGGYKILKNGNEILIDSNLFYWTMYNMGEHLQIKANSDGRLYIERKDSEFIEPISDGCYNI